MRFTALVVGLVLMLSTSCFALSLEDLPNVKSGMVYDLHDNTINQAYCVEVIEKFGLSLNAGYTTNNIAMLAVMYNIGNLKELGLNVPLAQYVDLAVGYSYGYENPTLTTKEARSGLILKVIDGKF